MVDGGYRGWRKEGKGRIRWRMETKDSRMIDEGEGG